MIVWVVLGVVVLVVASQWLRRRNRERAQFLEDFPFREKLDQRLARRHPRLSASQRLEILEGLRGYFQLCQRAGPRMVAMPSQGVDDAWHEFILLTRAYAHFCRRAFGRFLHHTPAEAMASPTQAGDGLRRAWRLACAAEGIDPKAPKHLPCLFALDARLGIAGGFVYTLDCLAAGGRPDGTAYCASHIGCGGGCGGDSGGEGGDGGDGGGGGCGGD